MCTPMTGPMSPTTMSASPDLPRSIVEEVVDVRRAGVQHRDLFDPAVGHPVEDELQRLAAGADLPGLVDGAVDHAR